MISYDITTADVERIGSHMQLIKSPLRCSQSNTTFAALTFLSFNLPVLHEVDIEILVDAWEGSKHQLPIHKNGAESRVLSRLKGRVTPTFLFKKNSYLPKAENKFDWIKARAFEDLVEDDDTSTSSDSDCE